MSPSSSPRTTPTPRAALWRFLSALVVFVAAIAVLSTARVFSGTVDEPAHIAAGMQWLSTGQYTYDLPHPPLARIIVALGPYLHGIRTFGAPAVFDEGAALLGSGKHYAAVLASARHGTIVFFILLAVVVWAWGRRVAGEIGGATATLLLITNPNILAHAGLATTDLACAATTTLALFAAVWWSDAPSWRRSLVFGLAIGLALGTRLSAIAFLGAPLVVAYVLRGAAARRWSLASSPWFGGQQLATSAAVGLFVLLALYRFQLAPLIGGVETFFLHGGSGHPTFLLGRPSNRGWWYYFPIALLVKTPISLLVLTILGAASATRAFRESRDWQVAVPIASALAILLVSMPVRVDLGVRLVLAVYPLIAVASAHGALDLLRRSRTAANGFVVGTLLVASTWIAVRDYPDYLSYFNELAGTHPEHVLVDSNLDWGQDLYRLRDTLVARGIKDSVRIAYFGTADPSAAGVPNARLLGLHEHTTGWVAASETFLAGEWVGHAYQWLLAYPSVARVGPSMRLWYIVPQASQSPAITTGSSPR